MSNSIKILSLTLIIFAILSISNIGMINSLFYDNETLTKKIEFGTIDTKIIEEYDTKPIVAGEDFKKIVKVKNVGTNPCFIRVKLLINPEKYIDELALDINKTDWEYKDGFYYYKEILHVNEETAPLFTKLHIPDDLVEGETFDINVYSESIQSVIYSKNGQKTMNYAEIFEKI